MAGKAESRRGPDFSLERELLSAPSGDLFSCSVPTIIGIDEAGRGPWAGPVVAGAAWINPDAVEDLPAGLDDSKKLSHQKRQDLIEALNTLAEDRDILRMATGFVSAADIDSMGILPATFTAMEMAVAGLGLGSENMALLVDGNLAPPFPNIRSKHAVSVTPIVKGDGRVLSIAVAALMAKQARDAEMQRLDIEFPGYGWASNMGYGTRDHAEALAKQGPTAQHRLSFRPVEKVAATWGYTR